MSCNDLLYKLTASNTTGEKVEFKINFEVHEGENVNLLIPANGFKGKLRPGETTIVGLLQKISVTDDS